MHLVKNELQQVSFPFPCSTCQKLVLPPTPTHFETCNVESTTMANRICCEPKRTLLSNLHNQNVGITVLLIHLQPSQVRQREKTSLTALCTMHSGNQREHQTFLPQTRAHSLPLQTRRITTSAPHLNRENKPQSPPNPPPQPPPPQSPPS